MGIGWRDPLAVNPGADGWRRTPPRNLVVNREFCATCWGVGRILDHMGRKHECSSCWGDGYRWVMQ